MSIIQTIREKGAVIVIAIIAISLIGFILMDSMSGTKKLFGGGNTSVLGAVNGEDIELNVFNDKVKEMEQQYPNSGNEQRNQIMESVWNQLVGEKIVEDQFTKLGLTFTPKEMSAIMFSNDAPQQLKQAFANKQTGQYDIGQAQQWWAETKKNKNEEQRNAIISQVIDPMRLNSLYTKYTSMISASIYQPKWLVTEQEEEKNNFARISYVAVPYTVINDSSVQVSDNDIENYLNKNKERYKQEAGRKISYVSFSAAANAKDSARIFQSLENLKPEFAADSNAKFFLGRNSSVIPFFDGYTPKAKIQIPNNSQAIIDLTDGGVYGPYLDGKNYVLAKKIATKILPDTIKCRHILLGTVNPQTQQPLMDDSTAHRIADSIEVAIKGGANFDSLEAKYSTDEAAKKDNGVMTFDLMTIEGDGFAKPFGDFLLNDKGETKKVVKTQFGWHYIEILDKKDFQPAYKIAYMAKEIAPSDETINLANSAAIKLSGNTKDEKSFNEYVAKNGLNKISVPNVVKENDFQLGGLQDARSIVKWAFDAKEGEVSEPFSVGDNFIVAIVDRKVAEGVPDVNTARPLVESVIRNEKKSGEIQKKLNNPSTLEAAAAAYNLQVLNTGMDSTLTFQAQIINGIGNEPKIAGAAFDKDFQAKVSPPIPGNTGIFVIKVNSIAPKTKLPQELLNQQENAQINSNIQSALGKSFNSLKKIADIKDNRSKFF
ncbi:MAG: SurA N-terminal domain-containing protein [Bacteroidota bacterium]|nr:SurA N-terminal domain-containing protein [Bacteroidota bacterium]